MQELGQAENDFEGRPRMATRACLRASLGTALARLARRRFHAFHPIPIPTRKPIFRAKRYKNEREVEKLIAI